jgi:hypothetical protein
VAATLFAIPENGGAPQTFVIDPSLFPAGPASPSDWKQRQGGSTSLTFSSPEPYYPPRGCEFCTSDSNYSQTGTDLANCRLLFAQEIDQQNGPPPYACPADPEFFTAIA